MYSPIKKGLAVLLSATVLVGGCLTACEEENALPWTATPSVNSYTVRLDDEQDGFDRAVLSWLSPSENAKTATFEYTVRRTEGKPTRIGLAYGKYTTGMGQAQNQGALYEAYSYDGESKFESDFATVGCTYRLTYDLVSGTPSNSVLVKDKNGKVTERKLSKTTGNTDGAGDKYEGEITRFGLYYYVNTTTAWTTELSVKCYDDTGKDLGLTYHGYAEIEADGATEGVLTTASKTDSYTAFGSVYQNTVVKTVYDQGLDENFVSYIEADERLTSLGADGAVLKFRSAKMGTNHSAFSFMFGKKLTKSEIEAGAELIVRVYVENNGSDYVRYTRLGAPDDKTPDDKSVFNGSNALSLPMYQEAKDGFVDIRLSNDFIKQLACENGDLTGITFYPCSHEPTNFVAYIDEIRYEIPTK